MHLHEHATVHPLSKTCASKTNHQFKIKKDFFYWNRRHPPWWTDSVHESTPGEPIRFTSLPQVNRFGSRVYPWWGESPHESTPVACNTRRIASRVYPWWGESPHVAIQHEAIHLASEPNRFTWRRLVRRIASCCTATRGDSVHLG